MGERKKMKMSTLDQRKDIFEVGMKVGILKVGKTFLIRKTWLRGPEKVSMMIDDKLSN